MRSHSGKDDDSGVYLWSEGTEVLQIFTHWEISKQEVRMELESRVSRRILDYMSEDLDC